MFYTVIKHGFSTVQSARGEISLFWLYYKTSWLTSSKKKPVGITLVLLRLDPWAKLSPVCYSAVLIALYDGNTNIKAKRNGKRRRRGVDSLWRGCSNKRVSFDKPPFSGRDISQSVDCRLLSSKRASKGSWWRCSSNRMGKRYKNSLESYRRFCSTVSWEICVQVRKMADLFSKVKSTQGN